MGLWGVPEPQPPRRPAASSGETPAPMTGTGFGAAFRAVVDRKLRELGGTWRDRPQRAQQAEAARRAAAEMARRIERQTGQRPSEATIRRNARRDRTPRGADQARLDRQAQIDAAGGVGAFASKVGVGAGAVARWRDGGRPLSPRSVRVIADVSGVMWSAGSPYPRSMTVNVVIDPPKADELVAAYAAGDLTELAVVLSPVITEQVEWTGEAERWFEVTEISEVTLR
ncbi:MAG: hypothetical protein E6R04_10810 [Spirochaetes bacterium]|nr:MAG: hypothetical protein E6R04_10810 [Spirochaetota bacterium]